MRSTFNTTFFIQRTRCNSEGKAPIYCRLTVNRETIHISTKQWVLPDHWDSITYRTTAQTKEEKLINKMLDEVQGSIQRHFYDMQGAGEVISAGKIKMRLCSTDERANMSIGRLFELFINEYEQLVRTQDYGHESFFRYKVCRNRVMDFISKVYKTRDLPLTSIDKRFLDKLYLYLRTERGLNNNTAVKFLHRFSSVYKMARDNGWVNSDPFKLQHLHLDKVDRSYLTQTELNKVMEKEFESMRLEQVRDVFIFCCFTGLPYIDAKKLTNQHLKVWSDGSLWLTLHRQKTKVPVNVKLLPIALEILDKYKDSIASRGGKLLPVLSNQKCNEYLKEMAAVCGIDKDITFHSARHTFATTVTLENGVPIESVSKMLGHTNVKTTQLYARITDTKVSNDMDALQENLQGVFDKPLAQSIKSRKKIAQADEIAQLAKELGVAL